MGWKNWSYWLRGGVVGVVIDVILFVLSLILPFFVLLVALFPYIIFVEIFEFGFLGTGRLYIFNMPNAFGWLVNFLAWFAVGAFVGWIYGKMKSKRVKSY